MSSTWETFEAESKQTRPTKKGSCMVGGFLDGLTLEDRTIVQRVLANNNVSNPWITEAMKARGVEHVPSPETVRRHRVKRCSCWDDESE